ncbi:MAG: exodeoxyribonuclease III [bacterium]
MRILSWNLNGLRAAYKKGFLDWFISQNADIVCVQEIKALKEQLPFELINISGYSSYFNPASRKGYSGVALWTKKKPDYIANALGIKRFDDEGRIIRTDYGSICLFNVYFPNGKASEERLEYKMDFYNAFLGHVEELRKKGKKIIICGDVNTAHTQIDLARPRENSKVSGFLPRERAWIDTFLSRGFVDTFRLFNKEPGNYTWWDMKTGARARNVGWRLDYFFASDELVKSIGSSFIMAEVEGSDHCPVGIDIEV